MVVSCGKLATPDSAQVLSHDDICRSGHDVSEGGLEHAFEGSFPHSGKFPWGQLSGLTPAPVSIHVLRRGACWLRPVPGAGSGPDAGAGRLGESLSFPARLNYTGPARSGMPGPSGRGVSGVRRGRPLDTRRAVVEACRTAGSGTARSKRTAAELPHMPN